MKKLLMVLVLMTMLVPSAYAQGNNWLGMFADTEATMCSATAADYATIDVYFRAFIDPVDMPNLSAVQFAVTNWPVAGVIATPAWSTGLVIDEGIGIGISLAWNPYPDGPIVDMGSVSFFILDASQFGADTEMTFVDGMIGGAAAPLVIVDGVGFNEWPAMANTFTWNCSGTCDCVDPTGTATDDTNWGAVKALY